MDIYTMTDKAIATELGKRIRSLRMRKNRTQEDVARATDISRNTLLQLESGCGKLSSLIAVVRELGALEGVLAFAPSEVHFSPIQIAKMKGKVRQRASRPRTSSGKGESEW